MRNKWPWTDWSVEKRILAIILVMMAIVAMLSMCGGCAASQYRGDPLRPGTATHDREVEEMEIPARAIGLNSALMITLRRTIERLAVEQPENAAGDATIERDGERSSATIPAAHRRPGPPEAPSPTSQALGWLVWVCGAIAVAGLVFFILRQLSGLHPALLWARALPKGIGMAMALGGGAMVAFLTVLDSASPVVIVVALCGAIGVGVLVATYDNWRHLIPRRDSERRPGDSR